MQNHRKVMLGGSGKEKKINYSKKALHTHKKEATPVAPKFNVSSPPDSYSL